MRTECLSEHSKEGNQFGNLGVYEKVILNWALRFGCEGVEVD